MCSFVNLTVITLKTSILCYSYHIRSHYTSYLKQCSNSTTMRKRSNSFHIFPSKIELRIISAVIHRSSALTPKHTRQSASTTRMLPFQMWRLDLICIAAASLNPKFRQHRLPWWRTNPLCCTTGRRYCRVLSTAAINAAICCTNGCGEHLCGYGSLMEHLEVIQVAPALLRGVPAIGQRVPLHTHDLYVHHTQVSD